jgi:type VI secretion system protein ImpH
MATPRRRADTPLADRIFEEPYRFDFFQAVRLLERLQPDRVLVGREGPPAHEVTRFLTQLSLSFPASAVHQLESAESGDGPPAMMVNFLGLFGPSGALPSHYTELLIARARQGDHTLAAFLDLLNHRLVSLFYRAWEKHHALVLYERGVEDQVARRLFDLIGLGLPTLRNRHDFSDTVLLFYSGCFARRQRPAVVLEALLNDYYGMPIAVEQFVGQWLVLEPEDRSTIGARGAHNALGVSLVLGERVWDEQGKIRLRVGPLSFAEFLTLLPGGPTLRSLAQMTRLFLDSEFDFDVQLVLRADEVPDCHLSSKSDVGACLGRHAWLKSRPLDHDVDDLIVPAGV